MADFSDYQEAHRNTEEMVLAAQGQEKMTPGEIGIMYSNLAIARAIQEAAIVGELSRRECAPQER